MACALDAESRAYVYLIRLVAFLLIVAGFVNKNKGDKKKE
jgi:hypothetical protein